MLVKLLETNPEEQCPEGALTTAEPRFISLPRMSVPKGLGWEMGSVYCGFPLFFALLSQLLREEKSPSLLDALFYTEFLHDISVAPITCSRW